MRRSCTGGVPAGLHPHARAGCSPGRRHVECAPRRSERTAACAMQYQLRHATHVGRLHQLHRITSVGRRLPLRVGAARQVSRNFLPAASSSTASTGPIRSSRSAAVFQSRLVPSTCCDEPSLRMRVLPRLPREVAESVLPYPNFKHQAIESDFSYSSFCYHLQPLPIPFIPFLHSSPFVLRTNPRFQKLAGTNQ